MGEQDDTAIRQLVITKEFRIRRSELVCPGNCTGEDGEGGGVRCRSDYL